jgi:hypothetical protein
LTLGFGGQIRFNETKRFKKLKMAVRFAPKTLALNSIRLFNVIFFLLESNLLLFFLKSEKKKKKTPNANKLHGSTRYINDFATNDDNSKLFARLSFFCSTRFHRGATKNLLSDVFTFEEESGLWKMGSFVGVTMMMVFFLGFFVALSTAVVSSLLGVTTWQATGTDCPCGHDVISYNMRTATHSVNKLTLSFRPLNCATSFNETLYWVESDGVTGAGHQQYFQSYTWKAFLPTSRVSISTSLVVQDLLVRGLDNEAVLLVGTNMFVRADLRTGKLLGDVVTVPNSTDSLLGLTRISTDLFALSGVDVNDNGVLQVIEFSDLSLSSTFKTPKFVDIVATAENKLWALQFENTTITLWSVDTSSGSCSRVLRALPFATRDNGWLSGSNQQYVIYITAYPPGEEFMAVVIDTASLTFINATFPKNFQLPSALVPLNE